MNGFPRISPVSTRFFENSHIFRYGNFMFFTVHKPFGKPFFLHDRYNHLIGLPQLCCVMAVAIKAAVVKQYIC